jgi:uncharacterized membrane protein YeaQ/YmgE (transglycosylase-associated protein family)
MMHTLLYILWTLLIGLPAGALAKVVMPGKDQGGIAVTMLLGVAGSFLASILGRAVGWYQTAGSAPGILTSSLGAVFFLGVYRLAIGRGLGRHDRRLDQRTR